MNKKEFEEELIKLCPNLYADMYGSPSITCMAWGIECHYGWYDLIRELSIKLEAEILKMPEEERPFVKAAQVKEKFGGLRFYLSSGTDAMYDLIDEAEKKSYQTCEDCGQPGKVRNGGWILTQCDECFQKREDKKKMK